MTGDYTFSLRCPDGAVWPDEADNLPQAQTWLLTAEKDCGCEESPHVIVRCPVGDWEPLP